MDADSLGNTLYQCHANTVELTPRYTIYICTYIHAFCSFDRRPTAGRTLRSRQTTRRESNEVSIIVCFCFLTSTSIYIKSSKARIFIIQRTVSYFVVAVVVVVFFSLCLLFLVYLFYRFVFVTLMNSQS